MIRPILLAVCAALAAPVAARADDTTYLKQGWDDEDRDEYYFLPQGSEVLPYKWFLALEEPWSQKLFRNDDHIASFRYIPTAASKHNPDGLPLGFARSKEKDQNGDHWFGLTCAACHTGEFTHKGKTVRVDGGTTLADLLGFQSALVASMKATVAQTAKFNRFARRVLGEDHTPKEAQALAERVKKHLAVMANWEATSRPARPGGHGSWDALGILLNTITGTAPGTPDNYRVPQTPVSYPSIWDTNRHDKLLWNASVESVTLRQVGEVIIVFGRATATTDKDGKLVFDSSADLKALDRVYQFTNRLSAPEWPEDVLGAIDRDLAKWGEKIYRDQGCATCHPLTPYPTVQPKGSNRKFIKITATPLKEVGTDPLYAEYFVKRTAVPGPLAPLFKGTMFEGKSEVPAAIQFLATLTKITEAGLDKAADGDPKERARLLGAKPLPRLPKNEAELGQLVNGLLAYKAAPLAGVWSTAPYLHNGSVSSLYELLLPAEKRKKTFHLGDREFDPKHVGYRGEKSEGSFLYDTARPGQSNRGHEYGTKLSDEDRLALIEFLKTL